MQSSILTQAFNQAVLVLSVSLFSFATPSFGQAIEDRYWILWEQREAKDDQCSDETECDFDRRFTSRMFSPNDRATVERLFGALDAKALEEGRLAEQADAPRICEHNAPQVRLGFDPETLDISEKSNVLRGITAIGLDLTKLKSPPGQPSTFGQEAHNGFVSRLEAAGIRVVTPQEAEALPGQPKFALYFSFTELGQACEYQYSFFSTLTQTALLTRDLETKVNVGVWSFMDRRAGSDHAGDELALVLSAADALVDAWTEANATQ